MNLEAWLKQERSLPDQLRVMEGICDALNEGHARGVLHRALEPFNIEVEGDGTADLSGAVNADASTAAAAARYRAPEVLEGSSYSPQADIYAVGVIFYEMLSGKSPTAEKAAPLGDLRPDVPRDLTDAVMGCLEKGPDWRPKDLSYLLQVVKTMRSAGVKAAPARSTSPRPASEPIARPTAPRITPSSPPRRASTSSSRGESRSQVPLIAGVLILLVGAGVGGYMWFQEPSSKVAKGPVAASPLATPTPATVPTPVATATPQGGKATPTPLPTRATPEPSAKPAPTPSPLATAVALTVAPPPPVNAATPTPTPKADTPPTPPPATPTPAAAAAGPTEPATLTAISPIVLKRGQTTILDVRGTNLRQELQLHITKPKGGGSAIGFSITKQRLFNPGLLQILVKLEETAEAGAYMASVVDPQGSPSNGLPISIVK
jgi:serine/threonine protein kinase